MYVLDKPLKRIEIVINPIGTTQGPGEKQGA
jgi:hypothetical protein